jgi:hypothetical protein
MEGFACSTIGRDFFFAPKLYIEGIRHEEATWDAAELPAEQRATRARTGAMAITTCARAAGRPSPSRRSRRNR